MEVKDLVDDDPDRFKTGRDGDHLMCPFQCELCHFVNINGALPSLAAKKDSLQLLGIRRAVLDACWARERSTVDSNRREGERYAAQAELMGMVRPYPPRGPFPIADDWGIGAAVILLLRSLAPGKNATNVQFETIRKTRSHVSNFIHTIPSGMGDMFITGEGAVSGVTNSPTNSLWFKRFMQGCHRRMGDVWCPDRPLTMGEALACQELLDDDWKTFAKDPVGRLKTALTGVLITAGLGGGMRGEEINRIDLGVIRKHWAEAMEHPEEPHVPLGMVGRFKRTIGEKMYVQPLAIKSASGLKYRLWMFRMIEEYARVGIETGPIFRVKSKSGAKKFERAKVGDLDGLFLPLLSRVQTTKPHLIGSDVDVEDEYSTSRSLKRGATAQARNKQIPSDVIEANNRWRKMERARGATPHMSLLDRYTDARASIPLMVRFSGGL